MGAGNGLHTVMEWAVLWSKGGRIGLIAKVPILRSFSIQVEKASLTRQNWAREHKVTETNYVHSLQVSRLFVF